MTSLRTFLDSLAENEFMRIKEPLNLDYTPTALVVELEKQKRFPALYFEQPVGFDMPVIANLFAVKAIIDSGVKPKGTLIMESVIEEEAGGSGGTLACFI